MKVLLCYICPAEGKDDYYMSLVPYGLFSAAAFLDSLNLHEVILCNYSSAGPERAAVHAAREKPDVIGVSVFTFNRSTSLHFIRKIKKLLPSVKIVAGGHHASFLADEILRRYPEIDLIIQGEGEKILADYLSSPDEDRFKKRTVTGEREKNPDIFPLPSDYMGKLFGINNNEQQKIIITTRGCPDSCIFCSSPAFWKRRTSFRSPEALGREIETIRRKFGIIYFSVRDDNFTLKKQRVLDVCELLKNNGLYMMWNCQARVDTIDSEMLVAMKRAGLEHIQLGVESGSQRILDSYSKRTQTEQIAEAAEMVRRAGLYLSVYLMTGMEGEDDHDTDETVRLIRKIRPHDGMVSPVALYPGTDMYAAAAAAGKIQDQDWFSGGDETPFLRNDSFVKRSMVRLLDELEKTGSRSFYRPADFAAHRKADGGCWITDIMEGDYWFDESRYAEAENMYLRVRKNHPDNIWPVMRLGRLFFSAGKFSEAERIYAEACTLVPEFFGGWLKAGETFLAEGKIKEAVKYMERALELNPDDARVMGLKRAISRKIMKSKNSRENK